jgi:hypothetical protein
LGLRPSGYDPTRRRDKTEDRQGFSILDFGLNDGIFFRFWI